MSHAATTPDAASTDVALDGSPLRTAAASSVFNWRGTAEAAAPTPSSEPPNPEDEETMATKPHKRAARARKAANGSPQMQICSTLMQHGDLGREALSESCSELTAQQFASALNNAKSQGRIAWIEKDSVFRLTKTGQEWVNAAGGDALAAAAPKKPKRKTAHRRGRAGRKEVDTSPTEEAEIVEPTFRCAVLSDGCFFITKDGVTIELEPEEHKKMLHYLERMAEPESA